MIDTFKQICLINCKVWSNGKFITRNLVMEGGRIMDITDNIPDNIGCAVIDLNGAAVLPALTDLHVHLREPGYSYKETIKTGSMAAAAGGFTTVCTMPNLNPAPDSLENLEMQLEIIRRDASVRILPFATITKKRMGSELVDYKALAPYVAGFSDDGSGVQDGDTMRKAMLGIAPTGKILAAHCEVESLLRGGYIHDGEYAGRHHHRGICSESEWGEVKRDIMLAEETGCRLHICHMSTKESVQLVRDAKKRGVRVTCETGPHYLTFTDEDLQEFGRFKMNPPIRSAEDREALREGVADGTIDVIATDHAPHSAEEKAKGLEKSAMGVVGLETAFSAVYTTMVKSGLMPFERLVEVMALTPRKILGMPSAEITVGNASELMIVDLDVEKTVTPSSFKSMGRATPYEGLSLFGDIRMTIFGDEIVYDKNKD